MLSKSFNRGRARHNQWFACDSWRIILDATFLLFRITLPNLFFLFGYFNIFIFLLLWHHSLFEIFKSIHLPLSQNFLEQTFIFVNKQVFDFSVAITLEVFRDVCSFGSFRFIGWFFNQRGFTCNLVRSIPRCLHFRNWLVNTWVRREVLSSPSFWRRIRETMVIIFSLKFKHYFFLGQWKRRSLV